VIELAILCGALIALVAFTLIDRRVERRQLLAVIDKLTVRIQAPQIAAVEAANAVGPESPTYAPPALIPDDDEAFWESREALAERAMRAEVGGGDG
jgi:hypothetical protein